MIWWMLGVVPIAFAAGMEFQSWRIIRAVDRITENGAKPWRAYALFERD